MDVLEKSDYKLNLAIKTNKSQRTRNDLNSVAEKGFPPQHPSKNQKLQTELPRFTILTFQWRIAVSRILRLSLFYGMNLGGSWFHTPK
jgi:hypothetical protein